MSWLDEFWADLLSEEPLRVMAVWVTLDSEAQESVLIHLTKMASEDGWADSQRESAQAAIDIIEDADS